MSERANPRQLKRNRLYSEQVGISLCARSGPEFFKTFLASILFGTKISESIAAKTDAAPKYHRLLTPRRIIGTCRDYLAYAIMDEGASVRYDGRKSDRVLQNCAGLMEHYKCRVRNAHKADQDKHDPEEWQAD